MAAQTQRQADAGGIFRHGRRAIRRRAETRQGRQRRRSRTGAGDVSRNSLNGCVLRQQTQRGSPPEGSFWEEMFTPPSAGGIVRRTARRLLHQLRRPADVHVHPTDQATAARWTRSANSWIRVASYSAKSSKRPRRSPASNSHSLASRPALVSEADSTSQDMQFFGAGLARWRQLAADGRFPRFPISAHACSIAWCRHGVDVRTDNVGSSAT